MKKFSLILLSILAITLTFSACGPNDAIIQAEADKALLVDYPSIKATVSNHVITLDGALSTEEQKQGAEAVVKNIKGVKSVVNEILVLPIPAKNADQELADRIAVAFTEAGISNVEISVDNQIVTIGGIIPANDQKKVLEIVNNLGNFQLVNQMVVK